MFERPIGIGRNRKDRADAKPTFAARPRWRKFIAKRHNGVGFLANAQEAFTHAVSPYDERGG